MKVCLVSSLEQKGIYGNTRGDEKNYCQRSGSLGNRISNAGCLLGSILRTNPCGSWRQGSRIGWIQRLRYDVSQPQGGSFSVVLS